MRDGLHFAGCCSANICASLQGEGLRKHEECEDDARCSPGPAARVTTAPDGVTTVLLAVPARTVLTCQKWFKKPLTRGVRQVHLSTDQSCSWRTSQALLWILGIWDSRRASESSLKVLRKQQNVASFCLQEGRS